jgi:hypothetical protein
LSDPNLESELNELFGPVERDREEYTAELAREATGVGVVQLEPLPEMRREPSGEHRTVWAVGLLIFALVSCSGIYALWQHTQEGEPLQQAALIPEPVAEIEPPADPIQEPAAEIAVAEPPLAEPEPAKPEPAKPQLVSAQEISEATRLKIPPEPRPAEPPPAPAAVPSPKSNRIVVEVAASEKVWVRMTAGRQTVFRGMLGAQERKSFEGVERTRVLVGDAGAVDIIWNGKSVGPVGRSGQMRVIEFTPDTFQILSP